MPILFLSSAVFALLAGCRGSAPVYYGEASLGFSAIIIRARIVTPTGETTDGQIALNFESDDGEERYRIDFLPGQTSLLRVEPSTYRLCAPRSFLGFPQPRVRVRIDRRTYAVPFPRELLRMDSIPIKPARIVPLGVIEARLISAERGERPKVVLRFDHGVAARRALIEDIIGKMMDTKVPSEIRNRATSWTRALEQALVKIQGEAEPPPAFKPFP
jgi:hypothetical protein